VLFFALPGQTHDLQSFDLGQQPDIELPVKLHGLHGLGECSKTSFLCKSSLLICEPADD
jgi:hypothetical protein